MKRVFLTELLAGSVWPRFTEKLLFAWNNLSRSYNLKQDISRFIYGRNFRNVKVSGAGELREIVAYKNRTTQGLFLSTFCRRIYLLQFPSHVYV